MLLQLYKVKRSHHGWNPAQNDRYAKAKEELLAAMTSTSFSTLERFPQRKMVLGEAQPVFLHDLLKQLLEQAAMSALRQTRTQEETLLRLSGVSVVDGLARYCQTLQRNIVNLVNYVKAAVKLSIIDKQQGRVLDFTTSPVPVIVARQKRPTTVLDQHHYLNQNHCRQYGSRAREESKGRTDPQRKQVSDWSGTVDIPWTHRLQRRNVTRQQQGQQGSKLVPAKDEAEVQRFCGLTSYYHKYINTFADITAPLHQLTQKDTPFQWTQESAESFQRLKASLTETPVLAYPRFDKRASTIVQMDASNVGLGAVLEQNQQMIGYASCTLTKAVVNYNMNQRECLAIVWAMKQFRHYLLRRPFQLMTDHAPCNGLEFSFETVYRKGTTNGNTDALLCPSYDDCSPSYDDGSPSYDDCRAPHMMTAAPHMMKAAPHMMTAAPRMMTASPSYDDYRAPCPSYDDCSPSYDDCSPSYDDGSPHMMTAAPHMMTAAPHMMTAAPRMMMQAPRMMTSKPLPLVDDCSPSYDDCSPSYDDCSPSYDDCSPSYDDGSPSYDDGSPSYDDCSPSYDDCSPSYDDYSPLYDDCSPSYDDCSPSYDDYSPSYDDCSPSYDDCSPSYDDCSPSYETAAPRMMTAAPHMMTAAPHMMTAAPRMMTAAPCMMTAAPSYDDCSPSYDDCSPSYDNCSPSYDDCCPSPSYDDCSPSYDDCCPSYDDLSPSYDDLSPSYDDCSPSYDDYSPSYDDCSPSYDDCSPSYDDCSPSYDDCSPSYDDCCPLYDDCCPSYDDCSPSYDDYSPSYDDCSPS
eukprot:Em0004g1086a